MALTYTTIATQTVTTPTSNISFQNIPNTYNDLILRTFLRSSTTSTFNEGFLRFNNNSSANSPHTKAYWRGGSSTGIKSSVFVSGIGSGEAGFYAPFAESDSVSGSFSNGEFYIPNYKESSAYRQWIYHGVTENNLSESSALNGSYLGFSNGAYVLGAITRIDILNTTFDTGSVAYLIGITRA